VERNLADIESVEVAKINTDIGNLAIIKRQQHSFTSPWSVPVVKWIFEPLQAYFSAERNLADVEERRGR
jgi:hypothetical protein